MKMISKNKRISASNGKVISVRGSVVVVCFENNLPPIYTLLHTGKDKKISIEVLTHLETPGKRH